MRRARILQKGAKYYVVAKINRGERAFESDEIKNLFLDIVKRSKKKYKYSLTNFVIMENHIHFIISPAESESLSSIMQWILSVFAMYYNKIHKLTGHFWNSRFFSKIIDDIKQLFDTFTYISENPVKASMVKTAEEYKYGGLYQIIMKNFEIIDTTKFDFLHYMGTELKDLKKNNI